MFQQKTNNLSSERMSQMWEMHHWSVRVTVSHRRQILSCIKQILGIIYKPKPCVLRTLSHSTVTHTTGDWKTLSVHISKYTPLSCVSHCWQPISRSHRRAVAYSMTSLWRMVLKSVLKEEKKTVKLQCDLFSPFWRIFFCMLRREVKIRSEGIRQAGSSVCTADVLLRAMEWLHSVYHTTLRWTNCHIVMLMLQLRHHYLNESWNKSFVGGYSLDTQSDLSSGGSKRWSEKLLCKYGSAEWNVTRTFTVWRHLMDVMNIIGPPNN